MGYIEGPCCIEHGGRKFCAGGAVVTPDRIVAYVGKETSHPPTRLLTDWHGKAIGTCRITRTWRTRYGTLSQIYATVDGVTYTGRGRGEGMIFMGRRCK